MRRNLAPLERKASLNTHSIKGAKGQKPARNGRIPHFAEVYQRTACEEAPGEPRLA